MNQPTALQEIERTAWQQSHFSPAAPRPSAPRIVVLGSLNMDLVIRVAQVPAPGETLEGRSIDHVPGGKGGNQAVASARQGASVVLFGAVGDDAHGRALRAALDADQINHDGVVTAAALPTGVALIMVDDAAQNRIVVIPGANAALTLDAASLHRQLKGAGFLLLQLETPLATVVQAIQTAQAAGCPVMLNPAPAQALPGAIWPLINTLVVNEGEAATYAGFEVASAENAARAARSLMQKGPARVIVTLGEAGAVAADEAGCHLFPGLTVRAIDTTAAGDTFIGALATSLASGDAFSTAVRYAIRASALCVTRAGAQPSIPHRAEVMQSPFPPEPVAV